MSDTDKSKPKSETPEKDSAAERDRSIFARLFGKPIDTPDREPDDWLFEDSHGFRIPHEDRPARDKEPEAEA